MSESQLNKRKLPWLRHGRTASGTVDPPRVCWDRRCVRVSETRDWPGVRRASVGSAWVLPSKATEKDGENLNNMKLGVNGVFSGAAEGLTRNLSKWVRRTAGNKSPVMGTSKEPMKVPARGRDGFKHLTPRWHEASLVKEHFKKEFSSLFNVPPSPPKKIPEGSEIS